MKRIVLYIAFLSFFISQAQSVQDFFKQGNEAYKKGDYQSAVSGYEKALNGGQEAPELYFNLANAYYKLNRIAPSIYYYEKALKLRADDEDVRYNLQLANQMKLDKIDKVPENFFLRLKKTINETFAYNTWAWISAGAALVGAVLFILFLFTQNTNTKRLSFVGMFLLLFLWLFAWHHAEYGQKLAQEKYAIVFSPKVNIMTEPNLTSDVVTVIHEGAKVKIEKQEDDWYLVKLPNGKKAWIPKSDVKVI